MKKKFLEYTIDMDAWNQAAHAQTKEMKEAINEKL